MGTRLVKNDVQEWFTMAENAHVVTQGEGEGGWDSRALLCLLQVKREVLPLVVEEERAIVQVKIFLIGKRVLGINASFYGYVQVQHLSI